MVEPKEFSSQGKRQISFRAFLLICLEKEGALRRTWRGEQVPAVEKERLCLPWIAQRQLCTVVVFGDLLCLL